jgi:hypothetical protein
VVEVEVEAEAEVELAMDSNLVGCIHIDYMDHNWDIVVVVEVGVEVVVEGNSHLLLPAINKFYEKDLSDVEKKCTCKSIEA